MIIVLDAAGALAFAALGFYVFSLLKSRAIDARYPPVGDIVAVEGGAIHVVEVAPTGAHCGDVVLLHGASGNHADLLAPLGERLSALGFRVFAIDRPGLGWSPRPTRVDFISAPGQRSLIQAALEKRGVRGAIIVGHSLGGMVALNFALDAPEFVRGLVLISPTSHPWPGGVDRIYHVAAAPLTGWLLRNLIVVPVGLMVMRKGVAGVFLPNKPPADYIETTKAPLILKPARYFANAEYVVALKRSIIAQVKRYGAIVAPTAIVAGDSDTVVYTHIHSIGCARDIAGATLNILKGVGHSPHHVAPDAVIAAIVSVDERARSTRVERSAATAALQM
jgi:pimeloyl-ACP methyl ester carboxylesterase